MKKDDQNIELLTESPTKEEKAITKKYKKLRNKFKMKKRSNIIILSIIVILIIIVVGIILFKRYQDLNKITIKDYELYQYFAGQKFNYTGELSLKRNGEITKLKYKDIEIDVDSTPIYFKNIDNEMLLPTNMGFYILRVVNKNYKLPYFSRIYVDKSENETSSYLKFNDEKIYLEKSFLFDGENLYVFLTDTVITVDDKKIELSALSYITVNYQDEVTYYDKVNDKFVIIPSHKNDVVAQIDGYKVNLSTDSIMYENNNKLLSRDVDKLATYKK